MAQNGIPVSGVVYDATNGKPLSGIHIRLTTFPVSFDQVASAPFGAVSREDGSFSNTAVTPGDYLIVPVDRKYCFDALTPREPKSRTVVSVRAGKPVEPLRIPLVPCGSISGRLLDDHGQPVPNVYIDFEPVGGEGLPTLSVLQAASPIENRTRPDGEFSLRLPPGKYLLRSNAPFQSAVRLDRPNEGPLANTWYPSAPDAKSATPVEVVAGGALTRVDLTFRRRVSLSISGSVTNGELQSTMVQIMGPQMSQSQVLSPNSTFSFTKLEPGEYKVRATNHGKPPASRSYSPMVRMSLRDRSEENVVLTVSAPILLSGRIPLWSPKMPAARLQLKSTDFLYEEAISCPIDAQGNFECSGLGPSAYSVTFSKELSAWFPKDLKLNGVAMKGRELDLSSSAASSALELSLGAAAKVEGRVVPRAGQSIAVETRLMLVPDGVTRLSGNADIPPKANPDGTFVLTGIAPGKYRLLALDPLSMGPLMSDAAVAAMLARGELIELVEGQTLVKEIQPFTGGAQNVR